MAIPAPLPAPSLRGGRFARTSGRFGADRWPISAESAAGIKDGRILDIKRGLVGDYDIVGEAVGFYKLSKRAGEDLKKILAEQIKLGEYDLGYEDILPLLFQRIHFEPVIVDGLKWVEIDFEEDVYRAENLAKGYAS